MKVPRLRSLQLGIVERIDHGEAVAHLVGQADGDEVADARGR